MMRYASIGLEFLAVFCLGLAGGVWLDRRAGGGTWWPVIGSAAGLAVAMARMFGMARQYYRELKERSENEETDDGSEPMA